MPGKPLSIDQLLKKFKEALVQETTNDPAEVEVERTILRALVTQNQKEILKELLELELQRDQLNHKSHNMLLHNPCIASTMAMYAIATKPSMTTMHPFASKLKTLVRTLRN